MAFLFQIQMMPKDRQQEKQYRLNLIYASMRLVALDNPVLGKAISDYFKKKEIGADGAISISQQELLGLEQKIGAPSYKKYVEPLLKQTPEISASNAARKKTILERSFIAPIR